MSAIWESSGAVKIKAKHALLLIGLVSLALFNTGCAGLVSANKSAPASTGDTTGPTVTITAPTAGKTESGSVTVSATATDSAGVTSVQFLLDGANAGSPLTASPYNYVWDTTKSTNGAHTLKATAKDANGNVGTSTSVSVTVENSTDTTPPTVSITSPANGATVTGTITVAANASDNVAVASVQFRVDGANVGAADTSAPYSYALNTATLSNGSHSLTAVAKDTAGNTTTSATVAITVNNAADTTPPTVSITSPANGATVIGTITISASASDNVGVASVQFLVDGSPLGAKDTTSPYSTQWNTASVSNGSHTIAAQAWDVAGNTATSSNVVVTVSQTPPPPPPPPAGDQITISDESGLLQINRPVSVARPFAQGEIANFAVASINGTDLLTQCDVKNRWPDGSLKFAIVSFVVPSISANGSVTVSFSNQTTGNNTGALAKSDMLTSPYNFDGQIQLAGAVSHNLSARAILNAATSCSSPTTDPDGTITSNLCTYWLQGPIVTAVILEDRTGRSFDVNADGGSGNPLHPRFEAWFYPSTNQVQLGYTLEDIWASATATSSARDQALNSVVLTGGNANPVTEFTNGAFTMITRSMFHKTYCINGPNAGAQFDCAGSSLHIDHNWPYLATTKTLPHWDTTLQVLPSAIAGEYSSLFGNAAALALQGCPVTACVEGFPGIGGYPTALDGTGASPHHGLVPTWDTFYLMTQCDAGNSTSSACGAGKPGDMRAVMLTNADLAGRIPYWFREADTNAGHGQTFDNSGVPGNVQTLGRVVSINARTQISLYDVTATVGQCNTNYTADYINYGGSGQDLGNWAGNQDTGHWPNIAYASYLATGQYHYYETQMMQAANALANSPGTRACTQPTQNGSLRMGSLGYWYVGDERGTNWTKRENLYGAFLAVDGSPEKAYFLDKLNANLAIEEALHGIPNDVGPNYAAAYTYAQTSRCNGIGYCPASLSSPLGVWNSYNPAYTEDGQVTGSFFQNGSGQPIPQSADSNFQAAFSGVMVGVAYEMGFTSSALLQYTTKRYIHLTQDSAANIYTLSDYVFPTTDVNGNWFTSYSAMVPYYAHYPTHWPGIGGGTCQGGDEPYDLEGLAALSYGYALSDSGFSAASGWNAMRSQLQPCWGDTTAGYGFAFDPKWDITPRTSTGTGSTSTTVVITAPTSGATVSGAIAVSATASAGTGTTIASVQFQIDGSNMGSAVTSAPFSQSLNTMALTGGQHSLTAVATDSANHQTTSAVVTVMVNNGGGSTTPPTVPTGLTASAVSSTVVNLSWTASTDAAGVTGYNVFRNGTQVGTAPSTTYQDSGLVASTSYSYTVSAFDGAGNTSAQSAPASVTTPASSGGNPLPTAAGWHKISFSELQGSENTSPCPANNYGGYGYAFFANCPAVMLAWSGGMADTARHRLIIWGGGHSDSANNEVYGVDLTRVGTCTATSPCIQRYNNPSNPTNCLAIGNGCDANPDGFPIARHTYQGLTYNPITDTMLSIGGGYYGGNGNPNVWTLGMSSITSACAPNCTPAWTHQGSFNLPGGSGEGNTSWWNNTNGHMYAQFIDDAFSMATWAVPAGQTTNTNALSFLGYNQTIAFDDYDQLVFNMGCYNTCSAFWISTATGSTFAQNNITLGASCGSIQSGYPIMAWDPVARVIRVLVDGSNVQYLLKPSTTSTTWNCTTETYGSSVGVNYPPAMASTMRGIYGRWNYFADWDVYILCNDPTQDCWYFRPNR